MNAPKYDKKHWLSRHLATIQVLERQGNTQQQIIEQLKTDYAMPFQLEKSLYSRHLKKIKAEQQRENQEHKEQERYLELKQYCAYLEQSNRDLLKQQQIHQQEQKQLKIEDSKQEPLTRCRTKNEEPALKLQIKRLEAELSKQATKAQRTQETLLKTQMEKKYYGFFALFFSIMSLLFVILLNIKS